MNAHFIVELGCKRVVDRVTLRNTISGKTSGYIPYYTTFRKISLTKVESCTTVQPATSTLTFLMTSMSGPQLCMEQCPAQLPAPMHSLSSTSSSLALPSM